LFASPDFKCGCRCRSYSTPDGAYTFNVNDPQHTNVVDGVSVWKSPLIDGRNQTYYWDLGWLTCTGGYDDSVCGELHSEVKTRFFCPLTKPVRWAPTVQVPNPPFRPASGTVSAGIVDDLSGNETWSAEGSGDDDQGFYGDAPYRRPAPFLFTSASSAATLAQRIADGMFFDASSQVALDALGDQFRDAQMQNNGQMSSAPIFLFAANPSGPIGGLGRIAEVVPLYPVPVTLGTSAKQQLGSMQQDEAFQSRPLMLLRHDCSVVSSNSTRQMDAQNFAQMLRAGSVTCVQMPGVPMASVASIQEVLFTGYGKGPPSAVGTGGSISGFPFAVDFKSTSTATGLDITLMYNGTLVQPSGAPLNVAFRTSAALNKLVNGFVDALVTSAVPGPRATMRYVRDMPTQGVVIKVDAGTFLGPLFYTWLSQMLLPVIVGLLVYEKEKNLRTMMRMQGLGDTAYMLVNYTYYFLLYFVFMLLIYLYGAGLGFGTNSLSMWTRSQPGVVIIFFILFINAQIATAFLFQAIFSSAKTATVGSVLYLLIAGLLGKFIFEPFLESDTFERSGIVGMELLVPFSLYRGFYEMAAFGAVASFSPTGLGEASLGVSWTKIRGSGGMEVIMVIFFVEWLLIMLAAWYLDQVYASGSGVKRHPLFFLECLEPKAPRTSCVSHIPAMRLSGLSSGARNSEYAVPMDDEPPDVRSCREIALATPPQAAAIVAHGLSKTYPGMDGAPPKVACRELSVAIPAGECFGLLGPNGAGKSTAINLLIGFLTPSNGSAFLGGFDLSTDLSSAYSMLGVCPQHDLLWEQLSAREHLRFYGRLRNLTGAELEEACDHALRGVNLFTGGVGDRPCGTYSGGMKRRLSVAIALIGDPPVVFLDEPSTGLDPASRATLWDVIKEAKKSRAIVLTTHAMEEAEELCDRLGVFVDGALRCVGAPKELTARYGGFLVLSLTTSPLRVAEAEAFVRQLSPNAQRTYALGGTLKYDMPLSEVNLADVFAAVTERKQALGILDWGVSSVTLEEVFIKLARDIGAAANSDK
jgi:ABC-type multidrug transport system ATPase subunit